MNFSAFSLRSTGWLVLACGVAALFGTGCVEESSHSHTEVAREAPDALKVVFTYGSEKEKWIDVMTAEFNAAGHETTSGQPIVVEAIAMGSGECVDEILNDKREVHITSPASAVFISLGNAESQTKLGRDLVGPTQDLVLSPVVIAMWKPMAEALGWPDKALGWREVHEMALNEQGWASLNYPQWGRFRFGHTHPEYSNSGIISLIAETYAGAGKQRGLTLADVADPKTGQYLEEIEKAIVHYGRSTGFFGRKMFSTGPEYLSAAVLYEIAFLTAPDQQERSMEFGFRPADVTIELNERFTAQFGVDPQQPQTTLEVPDVAVTQAILELWHERKKKSNVVLVLDTSGSMKHESKMANAKGGARQLIEMLGDEDSFSFLPFNDNATLWVMRNEKVGQKRDEANRQIGSLFANGGTALYDAIIEGHRHIAETDATDRINAIVVLSDGADRDSKQKLEKVISVIAADAESASGGVRVFTIGYGSGALADVLGRIADASRGKYYEGTPENIEKIFKEISTFF